MTAKNLKKSQGKSGTHATSAAPFGAYEKAMAKLKVSTLSLVALNDIYVIKEDPITITDSGLSADVEGALKSGRLIIPEAFQNYAEKFPCTGKIISKGPKTKLEELQVGTHVMFERLGVQRYKINGNSFCNCKEQGIHGIISD